MIAARQNLRKMLKQNCFEVQASACRKFDRQQSQKLRRPPAEENKQQLAALEKDLRELARREEKFSEELEPNGSGGPQIDPPAETARVARNRREAIEQVFVKRVKERLIIERDREPERRDEAQPCASSRSRRPRKPSGLSKLAQQDEAMTEDAQKRLGEAASSIAESSRAMNEGRTAEAAEKAREAARRLASLARQVGALKAKELSDMLARERDFAQAIARAERELCPGAEEAGSAGQGQRPRLEQPAGWPPA